MLVEYNPSPLPKTVDPTGMLGMELRRISDVSRTNSLLAVTSFWNFTPTWTNRTFVGSGLATKMLSNVVSIKEPTPNPAVLSQISLTSNSGRMTGSTNTAGLLFAVGQSVSFLGGPNSGNGYALNPIAQGHAGAGGYQLTVIEGNLNNIGLDALIMDAAESAYGLTMTGAGTALSTAGVRVYGLPSPTGFNYGFATSGNIVGAAFYDSSSPGASSSFVGQSGLMVGTITMGRKSLVHAYKAGGSVVQVLGRLENDTGGTGTAALGFSTTSSGTETRVARGGIGQTRASSGGGGPVTIFNRLNNDGLDFVTADGVLSCYPTYISALKPFGLAPMTTTAKNTLSASAGWEVFDTTLGKACVFNGTAWETFTST